MLLSSVITGYGNNRSAFHSNWVVWSAVISQTIASGHSICTVPRFIMMTSSNGNISALLTFVRGIHRWLVNSPHKDQWRGALMFYLICAWINGWVNNREAGDLRHHCAHYDVTVMSICICKISPWSRNVKTLNRFCCYLNHYKRQLPAGKVLFFQSPTLTDMVLKFDQNGHRVWTILSTFCVIIIAK